MQLLEVQRQINLLAKTPYTHPDFPDWLSSALISELAEVRDEFKPVSKWWKRKDQVLAPSVDLASLQTEITDLHFFLLTAWLYKERCEGAGEQPGEYLWQTREQPENADEGYQRMREVTRKVSVALEHPQWLAQLETLERAVWDLTWSFFPTPESFQAAYLRKALVNFERLSVDGDLSSMVPQIHEDLRLLEQPKAEV